MKANTTVIHYYGGPGCGKSTLAAATFVELKKLGKSVELVQEAVKEEAWLGVKQGPLSPSVNYGRQFSRESRLYGQVDFVVSDSPPMLAAIYALRDGFERHADALLCLDMIDSEAADVLGVAYYEFMLAREKPYDPRGRYENLSGALEIDRLIQKVTGSALPVLSGSVEERVQAVLTALEDGGAL